MFGFFSNIGPWELAIVILVALIVVGPEKLPEFARSVARTLGDLRDMGAGYRRDFEEAMKIEEFDELKKSVREIQQDMQSITQPILNPLNPPPASRTPAAAGAQRPPAAAPAGEPSAKSAGQGAPILPAGAVSSAAAPPPGSEPSPAPGEKTLDQTSS